MNAMFGKISALPQLEENQMKFFLFASLLIGVAMVSAATTQQQPNDVEKLLQVIENEKESLSLRGDLVDKLARMSARTAAPRLQRVLIERKCYADVLAHRILVYFEELPTNEAVPFLLEYEEFANQNNITMAGKVRTAFLGALEACKKAEKAK